MKQKTFWSLTLIILAICLFVQFPASERVYSQGRGAPLTPEVIARRKAIETELQSIAIVERKLMIPMRDGKRIATDVYRPERHVEEVSHDLCPHALQLQLLGRPQRRAARSVELSSRRSSAVTLSSR